MKEEIKLKRFRRRAFLWDQFIRPFYSLMNLGQLKSFLIAFIFLTIIFSENKLIPGIAISLFFLILFYEIYKYYKSGEFIHNYRASRYVHLGKKISKKTNSKNRNN